MLTTPFAAGSPNWTELATPDPAGAGDFYRGVFGWEYASAGPGTGGYGLFRLGGGTVAGVLPAGGGQAPPVWSVSFLTPDADATAKAAEAAGGSVVRPPADVRDLGRTATLADGAGVGFAVWQPGTDEGLDLVDVPGALTWIELYTPDEDAAFGFYSAVFGWEALSTPIPGGRGTYRMVNPAGRGPDAMFGGFVPLGSDPTEAGSDPHWLLYFAVTDCDATVTRTRTLGGTVLTAPADVEGVGRFAKLTDPYGASFAIMQGVAQAM
ncbi:VOC family protein [Streptomyces liangshanensis]|uniref:VOC family protein n=1 Tax=Streptomyces liangshanensis TaxID=2717324 RepID=UPI0036DBBC60